jgi:hypothetical protein
MGIKKAPGDGKLPGASKVSIVYMDILGAITA